MPPFMANRAGRPRGPPPFIVQLLRAPLTLNNIIALLVTKSVQHHRLLLAHESPLPGAIDGPPHHGMHPGGPPPPPHHGPPHGVHHHHGPCGMFRPTPNTLFNFLSLLFILSALHNVLSAMRMRRIRKSVFGESMCATRRRWRRGDMTEEEKQSCGQKFKEMGKKMPSLFIAMADMFLAVGFMGAWMLTLLLGGKEGKVEMGVGYASVGALVACILNFLISVNGLKMWARSKRQQKETAANVEEVAQFADEKAVLLEN